MRKKIVYVVVLMLVLICGGLFFLTHFFSSSIIAQDGYYISDNTLEKNLISENKKVKNTNIKLNKMKSSDNVYSNLGKVYVGNEDNKSLLNTNFPVFTNNGLAIVNINSNNKLINKKFEYFDTYENFTVTDGKVYNFMDLEQSDYEDYIFLMLENGTYVNLYEINLEKNNIKVHIPVNSIINFQEDYLKYYYFEKSGKLIYNYVEGIGYSDFIKFNEKEYTYEDFLVNIDKISGSSSDDGENEGEEEYILDGTEYTGPYVNYDGSYGEVKYRKPEVRVDDFNVNVYTGSSKLRIADPAGTITGGINFLIYIGDKLYSRKTFVSSGKIDIDGLMPNTTYTIVGNYKYYNENKKKMEVNFYNGTFTTGDYKSLPPIDLLLENGDIYPNKIELKEIQVVSDIRNDALNGFYKMVMSFNDYEFNLPSGTVKKLSIGKVADYTTPPTLKGNTIYNYVATLYDGFGNKLNVINNTGTTRTSKEAPTSNFKLTTNDVGVTKFDISLKNPSNVNISNYRYVIYNESYEIVSDGKIDSSVAVDSFTLDSLDPNRSYTIQMFADFDVEDGRGTQNNVLIGEGKFTTMPLSSLGYLRVFNNVTDITYDSATINTRFDLETVSPRLLSLLSKFKVEIIDPDDEVFYSISYGPEDIASFIAGDMKSISLSGLKSVTNYKIVYTSEVTQGSTTESISVLSEVKMFRCKKVDAIIEIQNRFVNKNMIDFDVRVVDQDEAIESNHVLLEVRDSVGKLIALESLDVNGEFVQLSYTKLDPESKYSFKYYAEEYNVGYDNSTYETDHVILLEDIITEDGISGTLEIQEVTRQITGTNLFNLRDFDRIRKEGNTSYRKYDLNNNAVMFGGKNGYVNFSYYLPEAYYSHVTVSFEAKYDPDSPYFEDVYFSRSYNSTITAPTATKLEGLTTTSWKRYSFSFNMSTYYIGFLINATASVNRRTNVWFRNIQVSGDNISELASKDGSYSVYSNAYTFSNAVMKSGNDTIPSQYTTGTDTGNYGNGFARITNLTTGVVTTFTYKGSEDLFTVPNNGTYKIELWGAAGGDGSGNAASNLTKGSHGGRGAYTSGNIQLTKDTVLHVYVGGKGTYGSGSGAYGGSGGGFNGGGNGGNSSSGSGGGATDVRLVGGTWNDLNSLKSRIMVAAGGGGTDDWGGTLNGSNDGRGGAGGALVSEGAYINGVLYPEYFASQTNGYKFGIGENASVNTDTGGAGGGYFGGFATNNSAGGAAGGSSYISGYKGCVAYKYIQEANDTYTEYTEKEDYYSSFKVNVLDKKSEIPNNSDGSSSYYIRIFLNDEEISSSPYIYNFFNDRAVDEIRSFALLKNKKYELRLSIKIRDRFYDLDSIIMRTNSEIRTIKNTTDFFNMHPNGKFVVVEDLDLSTSSTTIPNFYGEIDFQGHTIKLDYSSRGYLFQYLRGGAVLKNLVIDMTLNKSTRTWNSPFVLYNYGTIDNIIVNITQSYSVSNTHWGVINYANYGTIKNFIINSMVPVHTKARFGMVTYSNQGLIKNGYIYGEDIDSNHESADVTKDVGVVVCEATTNSRISNVLSLITVRKDKYMPSENNTGNLVGYANVGKLYNLLSVETTDTNDNLTTQDPNFGRKSASMTGTNVYFASKKSYNASISSRISYLSLYDKNFMEDLFNSEDAFKVSEFVSLGYYPQLKLNNCMPKQDWLKMPELEDSDLIDVTSVEEISNDGDSAVVKINLNNPTAETIESFGIQDINTTEILEQVNEGGKSSVTVKLSNPMSYKSVYYLRVIKARGASGHSYDIDFGAKDRALKISLYRSISTTAEWMLMKTYPEDNFMLKADLNFQGVSDSGFCLGGTRLKGILNGAGHTIKNITVTKSNGFMNYLDGQIINLNIDNFNLTYNSSYGGFIYQMQATSIIDNVHMTNVTVKGSTCLGGIVGYNYGGVIINSSVTNFTSVSEPDRTDIRIGAIAGLSNNNGYISNCFAQNVNISIMDSISVNGVGGIVGEISNGSVMNSYATGSISTNSPYVGGIAGNSSALINNVWSNVNIYAELDYVGGIVGKRGHDNVSSTLVFGPVYSSYPGLYVSRTNGNSLTVSQKNYFWENQPFNGYVSGNAEAEKPLSSTQINDIETYFDLLDFNDQFTYDDIDKGILPKLKSTRGDLLPNQLNNTYSNELFDVQGTIEVNQKVETGDIYFILDNPDNKEVVSVGFDYLKFDNANLKITPQDGSTIISISNAYPTRYFDSYSLNKVYYKLPNGKTTSIDKHVKVNLKFYNNISSYTDWSKIDNSIPENYRVTGVIDFANASNINYNLAIARLEGQGDGAVIKNMTFNDVPGPFAIIRKLTTSLKNITFENITINIRTTGSYSNYANIIRLNFADISNCEFSNITINAPNVTNYTGPIGLNRGYDIRDVHVHDCNIKGNSYVSAFIAHSQNLGLYNLNIHDCTVYGSGSYVGAASGFRDYSNPTNWFYVTGNNLTVTGKTNVGALYGYGGADHTVLTNSHVYGIAGGNRVGGVAGYNYDRYAYYYDVDNCEVYSDGTDKLGGIFGEAQDTYYVYINNSRITNNGTSNSYTGAVQGYKSGYTNQYGGAYNCDVKSNGTSTGGLYGYIGGSGSIQYYYITKSTVTGANRTGGAVGTGNMSRVYYTTVNAKVISVGSNVGGVYGYITAMDPSDTAYADLARYIILENADITGVTDVGLFSGYAPAIYDSMMYIIFLSGNVSATGLNPRVGIEKPIAENDTFVISNLPRFHVYDKSKLNKIYVTDLSYLNDTLANMNVWSSSMIATQSNWTGNSFSTSYFSYTDYSGINLISNGYFPFVKLTTLNQKPVSLPRSDIAANFNIAAKFVHELPKLDVYSSGAYTVNLEFANTDEFTDYSVYENDILVHEGTVDKRVFTFNYNYKSNLKVILSDGVNTKEYKFKASDLINKVSTFKNSYAYIYDGVLKGNIDSIDKKVIHIYDKYVLTDDLEVYDISNGNCIAKNNTFKVKLVDKVNSLFKFEVDNTTIDTFYNFSIIHKPSGDMYYEAQLFVKNGEVEIIDSALDNVKTTAIIDEYGNKSYVTVLGDDGVIYNIKDEIKLPVSFNNNSIKYMSNNINNESNIAVVMYNSGKVVVFDYRTGTEKLAEKATKDISFFDYVKESVTSKKNLDKNLVSSYNDSLALSKLLNEKPISVDSKGKYDISDKESKDNEYGNYITYYNAVKKSYDVINANEIVYDDEVVEEVKSENDKIYSSPELINFYMHENSIRDTFNDINLVALFSILLFSVIITLVLWFKNAKDLKVEEN